MKKSQPNQLRVHTVSPTHFDTQNFASAKAPRKTRKSDTTEKAIKQLTLLAGILAILSTLLLAIGICSFVYAMSLRFELETTNLQLEEAKSQLEATKSQLEEAEPQRESL